MPTSSNKVKSYITLQDFGLVTALTTRGYKIVQIYKLSTGYHFVFRERPVVTRAINKYYKHEFKVSARQYHEKSKKLLERMYGKSTP